MMGKGHGDNYFGKIFHQLFSLYPHTHLVRIAVVTFYEFEG